MTVSLLSPSPVTLAGWLPCRSSCSAALVPFHLSLSFIPSSSERVHWHGSNLKRAAVRSCPVFPNGCGAQATPSLATRFSAASAPSATPAVRPPRPPEGRDGEERTEGPAQPEAKGAGIARRVDEPSQPTQRGRNSFLAGCVVAGSSFFWLPARPPEGRRREEGRGRKHS